MVNVQCLSGGREVRRYGFFLLGFGLALGFLRPMGAMASTTSISDPVGFLTIDAGGGTAASPTSTFIAPSFVNPAIWSGTITGIAGKTITVSSATWTAGEFDGTYYLEITSGASAGTWTGITATTATAVTTSDDLSAVASAGATAVIRRYVTLSDFLGASNQAGVQAGSSVAAADEVVVYDGATPAVYWYYDGSAGGTAGWYDTSYHSAAKVILPPGHGIVLKRKNPVALSFPVSGTVKRGPTRVGLAKDLNVLANPIAGALPLVSSNLYTSDGATGVLGGSALASADQVVVYGASGPAVYWYYDGTQGGTAGWYDSSYQSATAAVIPAGASFVVQRKTGPGFVWSVPAQIP